MPRAGSRDRHSRNERRRHRREATRRDHAAMPGKRRQAVSRPASFGRRPQRFDSAIKLATRDVPRRASARRTSRKKTKRRRPPNGTAPSRAHALPAAAAPAAVRSAHSGESGPAIRSPSPASDLLDRRKILRGRADTAGPARGLRVGGQGRRSRKQQSDRQGTCLRIVLPPEIAGCRHRFVAHTPAIKYLSRPATANGNAHRPRLGPPLAFVPDRPFDQRSPATYLVW